MANQASTGSYRVAAKEKFAELKNVFSTNDAAAFWKLGNSFDTMTDYLEFIDAGSANEVAQMAVTQFEKSLKHISGGYDGAWFDDFGWWSVATQRALLKPFFRASWPAMQQILDNCWSRYTSNAPFVWARRGSGTFEEYGPAVEGGVWNAYWAGTSSSYPGPKNGDPSNGKLIGIQNTVTNALYLTVAQRLGATDPAARAAAQREFKFFFTWFEDGTDTALWWKLDGKGEAGLVRERVGRFANADGTGFQENWAWTGDQGLMLGALSDAMTHQDATFRGQCFSWAKQLLLGAQQRLTQSNVVQNWTKTGSPPDGDEADYQTGTSAFWRNILYVWKTNPDLRELLATEFYSEVVRASANDAANAPTKGQTLETLTNQCAVLIAAAAMLE